MSKKATVLTKCLAKDCKTKVRIILTTTDTNNASLLFFKFCRKHAKLVENKLKEIREKPNIKEVLIKEAIKQAIDKEIKN